jgi:hypothetical protein
MESKRERLRRRYRPPFIRILFIGESPPASGRFFYQQDSGLYRAMRDAFRVIDPSIPDEGFLTVFQSTGCYLIDTCTEPVDHLDAQSRRAARFASEPSLSRRIGRLQPASIVTLLRSSGATWGGRFWRQVGTVPCSKSLIPADGLAIGRSLCKH